MVSIRLARRQVLTIPGSRDWFPTSLWAFGGNELPHVGTKIAFNMSDGVAALQRYEVLIDR